MDLLFFCLSHQKRAKYLFSKVIWKTVENEENLYLLLQFNSDADVFVFH